MPSSTGIPLTIVGGTKQWPGPNGCAILPPLTSPIEGPGNIGQMHWASSKDAIPSTQPDSSASHLTLIFRPVVQTLRGTVGNLARHPATSPRERREGLPRSGTKELKHIAT